MQPLPLISCESSPARSVQQRHFGDLLRVPKQLATLEPSYGILHQNEGNKLRYVLLKENVADKLLLEMLTDAGCADG